MESNMLNDGASVSSSFHTHSTDVSTSNNFPTIRLNSVTGAYIDEVYSCFQNPKQLKKLNFVKCSERSLELHESEKSFDKKKKAKNIIDLSTVYSITKRVNQKIELCLMLVTPEQTVYLRGKNEANTNNWYVLLMGNIQTSRSLSQNRPFGINDLPENTWDVNVTFRPKVYRKALEKKVTNLIEKDMRAFGRKRLCFFPHAVVLVQMHSEPGDLATHIEDNPDYQDPDNYFYFPRTLISFYGAQNRYFFIKTSTSFFGNVEVFMDCESKTVAAEIFNTFKHLTESNVAHQEKPWQTMLEEIYQEEDEDENDYYRPQQKNSTDPLDNLEMPLLKTTNAYYTDEQNEKKNVKEVRFKTEEHLDLQPVENALQEPSIDDGDVGKAIAVDIIRRNTNKISVKPVKESSNPFTGIFASIRKKFHDKSPPNSPVEGVESEETEQINIDTPGFKQQVSDLKTWAENRASIIEEETEDSGGTLKIDDPTLFNPEGPFLSLEEQRKLRRDALLANALKEYNKITRKKVPDNAIEMTELASSHTDESTACTSTDTSSCTHSTVESESSLKSDQQLKAEANSSTSALDSCISNTSEDFSASSSVSNVEYTWKPIMKVTKTKKLSLDTHSCSGRYTSIQVQDDNSDLSVDSCYSSLTNNGYNQLPKSQSLTHFICEISSEGKKPVKINKKCIIEPIEEVAKLTLKPIKSSSDIMSDVQQEALRSEIIKSDDPESVAAAIRQRAASLGNKSWAVTPLGQSIRKHRHRHDCKKRKSTSSANNSTLSEEQPLLGDPRHSSISSQSEQSCSHRKSASVARARLANALLHKNPRRSNTEDLAEITFQHANENGGGSLGSMHGSDSQRETIQVFDNTNRALIPTTRYSEGSNSSIRNKARKRHQKGLELEPVECFLDPRDFKMIAKKPQKAASSSSHESVDNSHLCKHGKPRRSHHSTSNHSQEEGNENRHSCRRKHRTSCQDAIAEEEGVNQAPESLSSQESPHKSDDHSVHPELNLDLLNNNPNPVSILA